MLLSTHIQAHFAETIRTWSIKPEEAEVDSELSFRTESWEMMGLQMNLHIPEMVISIANFGQSPWAMREMLDTIHIVNCHYASVNDSFFRGEPCLLGLSPISLKVFWWLHSNKLPVRNPKSTLWTVFTRIFMNMFHPYGLPEDYTPEN